MSYIKQSKVVVDIEDVESLIYNDLPVDSLYPKNWNKEQKLDSRLLLDGEKVHYYQDSKWYNYCVTSEGRIFNVRTYKQFAPTVFYNTVNVWMRNSTTNIIIDLEKYFDISVDRDMLKANYEKNKWEYYLYNGTHTRELITYV